MIKNPESVEEVSCDRLPIALPVKLGVINTVVITMITIPTIIAFLFMYSLGMFSY